MFVALGFATNSPRTRSNFDDDWRFHLGGPSWNLSNSSCPRGSAWPCAPGFDDSEWRQLSVPHDFVVEGTISESEDPNHGALATNVAWYRKSFDVMPGSALHWLTFDGVFRAADVFVNGAFVRHHEEGYTSFTVWLHNASAPLRYGGANEVVVYLDATEPELWCYEGGGIFRHVWLESAGAVSIVPWGFAAPTAVEGPIIGADPSAPQTTALAAILPRIDIANAAGTRALGSARITLETAAGALLVDATVPFNVSAGGFARLEPAALRFGSAAAPVQLWNTQAAPPLYTARVALLGAAGEVLDAVSAKVGVRDAVFDARRGFVLNGAPPNQARWRLSYSAGTFLIRQARRSS